MCVCINECSIGSNAMDVLRWIFTLTFLLQEVIPYSGFIPIGAIFDGEADVLARTGYQYAISRYTKRVTEGLKFTTVYDEVDINDNFMVASKICSQMAGGVFAFFGSTRARSFSIIQSFSQTFHMPYMSFSLSGTTDYREKPYMLFMKPLMTEAIVEMISAFQWTHLDYLYDSDDGLRRLQYIYNTLKDNQQTVEMGFRRIDDISDVHDDLRRLDRHDKHSWKNVILDMSSQEAYRLILKQIPEVGMNRYGYNYLLCTLDILSLNLTRFQHGGVNVTGFQLVNHTSSRMTHFLPHWQNLESSVWPGAGVNFMEVDAALAVDAVETIRRALEDMLQKDKLVFHHTFRRGSIYNLNETLGIPCTTRPVIPWMHGQALYRALKRVQFDGLTGRVAFDSKGFRYDYRLAVMRISLNRHTEKIGEWSSERGLKSIYDKDENPRNTSTKPTVERLQKVVVSILTAPFLMRKEKPENGLPLTGNDRYEGYCKQLAEEISKRLKFTYIFRLVEEYGKELPNGTWDGMIGELRRGMADLTIAPLTITAKRERVVDFSKPFMNIGISIMIKRPEKMKPGVFSFMEPFSIPVWVCITVAYVVVSFSMFLVSRFSPYEWRRLPFFGNRLYNQFTVYNSFWFSMGALMMQGSEHCPRSSAGRLIGGAWWFFVLITISSYTANLAAFLTIERMRSPIESADHLAKQTEIAYGTREFGSTREFFETSNVMTYKTMYNFMTSTSPTPFAKTISEGVGRVRSSKWNYAFLLESSMNDYYNNRKPCNTMRVGPNLNLKGFGIATPLGSNLKKKINYAVLKLKEDGTLHKLKETWWYEKGECASHPGHRESKKRSLSLSNVSGVFYILISGLVGATVMGILEIFCLKKRLSQQYLSPRMKRNETRLTIAGTPQEQINGLLPDIGTR